MAALPQSLRAWARELPGMRALRLARLGWIARHGGHPDWRSLIGADWPAWDAAKSAASGAKVLIATGIGGHLGLAGLDSTLGVALTLAGARVGYLLCDETLPACQIAETGWYPRVGRFSRDGPRDLCGTCFAPAAEAYRATGLPLHLYGDSLTDADRREAREIGARTPFEAIGGVTVDGVGIGEQALAGALRFFARGTIDAEPEREAVARRYLEAAILTYRAVTRLVRAKAYEIVVTHHGIYVPQGPAAAAARTAEARVVTWNPAYRKHCFLFSHDDTYHRTLMDEPVEAWAEIDLSGAEEARVVDYLKSRWTGSGDWIWFHEKPDMETSRIVDDLGLDTGKPIVGMLTNVVWDAQLHYPANAYPSMIDWVMDTIAWFAARPDLQLVIRVHPAELRGTPRSRQRMVEEIGTRYPQLPANVVVVGPDSPVSTYALMELADTALIYGTKMGVELTAMGIPAIVAGEAWIRNKGLTLDATSPEHYRRLLADLPIGRRLDPATVRRARAYAYHFFFRRMIPLAFMAPTGGWPPFRPKIPGLHALGPGADPGLDVVVRGILDGSPFIYPAERMAAR